MRCGNMRDAAATLTAAAGDSTDPSLTIQILHHGAEASADTGDLARVSVLGARARGVPAQSRRDEFCKLVLIGFATLFDGEHARARMVFDQALDLARELDDDPQAQIWAANAASGRSDLGAGLPFATRAVQLARAQGKLSLLPVALEQLGARTGQEQQLRPRLCGRARGLRSVTRPRTRLGLAPDDDGRRGGRLGPGSGRPPACGAGARAGRTQWRNVSRDPRSSHARPARADRRQAR